MVITEGQLGGLDVKVCTQAGGDLVSICLHTSGRGQHFLKF